MEENGGAIRQSSKEEDDNLRRSKTKNKEGDIDPEITSSPKTVSPDPTQTERSPTYMEKVMGGRGNATSEDDPMEADEVESDDDLVEENHNSDPWFSMRMTRSEKIEARKPWHSSLLIKFIGGKISYHNLSKWIQAMWRL